MYTNFKVGQQVRVARKVSTPVSVWVKEMDYALGKVLTISGFGHETVYFSDWRYPSWPFSIDSIESIDPKYVDSKGLVTEDEFARLMRLLM